jgi:hypothetical protein
MRWGSPDAFLFWVILTSCPQMMLLLVLAALALGQEMDKAQAEHSPDIPWNGATPWAFPQQVHEWLEKFNWGDFHLVFHMTRHYYTMDQDQRSYLDSEGEPPAPFMEGDPLNGVEFLAMHRSMMEYIRQRFGSVAVTTDPEGRKTINEVMDGWRTDADVENALRQVYGSDTNGADQAVRTFHDGLANVNNFGQFKTEDDFGLFLQTAQRLDGTVNPNDPATRRYTTDGRTGAGVHNWLHGQFEDDNSPITVGNPRTNLPSILFWRIHGWIEAKWKAFEASRTRSADEEQVYEGFITLFRAHMVRMSEKSDDAGSAPVQFPGGAASSCAIAVKERVDCKVMDKNGCILAGCCWMQVPSGPWCYKSNGGGNRANNVPGAAPATTTTTKSKPWWSRSLQGVRSSSRRVRQDVNQLEKDAAFNSRNAKYGALFFKMQENMRMSHRRRRRTTWDRVYKVGSYMFRNHIRDCAALARGVTSDDCPLGNRSPGIPAKDDLRPGQIRSRKQRGRTSTQRAVPTPRRRN